MPEQRTVIVAPHDVPPLPPDEHWLVASASAAPHTLLREARHARWNTWLAVTFHGDVPVGIMSLHQWKAPAFPSPLFDPETVAPGLLRREQRPANSYLMVGNISDQVSAYAVLATVDPVVADRIGHDLTAAAFGHARDNALIPVALYVRDEQARVMLAAAGGEPARRQLDTFAVIDGFEQGYLASLGHSRRSVVRRDLKRLQAHGLSATVHPAADLADEAGPLVSAVKHRHDVADHPRLAALRLRQWAADPFGRRVVFCVRDGSGTLLAAMFGCHRGDTLELYEIGLVDDSPLRQLAYYEAMVYAPMRFAEENGCRSVHLGLGTPRPKDLRGARFSPVWAIAGTDL